MALHFAIRKKHFAEIRRLVESGCDVNGGDHDLRTPLMMCCIEKDELWASGIVRMLLQAGAQVGRVDRNGRTSLMFSVLFKRQRLTTLFVKALDCELDQVDFYGNTALHYCALCGNLENTKAVLDVALRRSANPLTRNKFGQTPLSLALQLGYGPCVDLFQSLLRCKEEDFICKAPTEIMLRPWREEINFVYHPDLIRKNAIDQTVESAQLHRMRPILNPSDTRTTRKYYRRRKRSKFCAQRRGDTSSSPKRQLSADAVRASSAKRVGTADSSDHYTLDSWKLFLPSYLLVQQKQRSPTYRRSAAAGNQSYEEILRLFPDESASSHSAESSDVSDKLPATATLTNRRKTMFAKGISTESLAVTRNRSKSNAFEAIASISSLAEGKRRCRRLSTASQSTEQSLSKKKSLTRSTSDNLEPNKNKSEAKAATGPTSISKTTESKSTAVRHSAAPSMDRILKPDDTKHQKVQIVSQKSKQAVTTANSLVKPNQPKNKQFLGLHELGAALSDIVEE